MPLILHPHVIDVLNTTDDLLDGHELWEQFEQVLAQMAETQAWQKERYDFFRQGQKRTAAMEELRVPVEDAFAERANALATLQSQLEQRDLEVLSEAVRSLQKASQRIAKGTEALEAEDTRQRLTPLPLLHDFLQAGFNVYGDYEPFSVLKPRLGPLVSWVQSLEKDWAGECELFETLRDRQPVFDEAVNLFKNGIGAVVVYEESGDSKELLAALTALQEAGNQLAQFVHQASVDATDLASYSNSREIERFAVRQASLGADDPSTQEARQQVVELLERQSQQMQGMADIPFHSEEYAEGLAEVEAAWTREQEALESGDIEALGEASMAFQSSLEKLGTLLDESSQDLSEAPALQELRRAVLGVYYNQVPRRFLKDLLFHIAPGFAKTLETEFEDDAIEALETCLHAFECAQVGLNEGSTEALAESWRLLNVGGAQLIAVQQRRVAQAAAEEESRKVTCTQCGCRQEPSSSCVECGAKLMKVDLGVESSSMQLSEGESSNDRPQSLRELFDLVSRIREGVANQQEILSVVDPVRTRAQTILKQATKGGASEDFVRSVQVFSLGLDQLADQARERNLEKLEESSLMLQASSESILSFNDAT